MSHRGAKYANASPAADRHRRGGCTGRRPGDCQCGGSAHRQTAAAYADDAGAGERGAGLSVFPPGFLRIFPPRCLLRGGIFYGQTELCEGVKIVDRRPEIGSKRKGVRWFERFRLLAQSVGSLRRSDTSVVGGEADMPTSLKRRD
jgi:hypothetical protein